MQDGEQEFEKARLLLAEALDHITDKPWDEPTLLHARISRFIGLPVQYPAHVKYLEQQISEISEGENDGNVASRQGGDSALA